MQTGREEYKKGRMRVGLGNLSGPRVASGCGSRYGVLGAIAHAGFLSFIEYDGAPMRLYW